MDFKGSDEDFIAMLQKESTDLIGQFVSENENGFIEGMNDLIPFLRENTKAMIRAISEPQQATAAEVVVATSFMKYVENAGDNYRKANEELDTDNRIQAKTLSKLEASRI